MDFQQIRDFVNPAVAQATGLQEVENLSMSVPVAYVPVQLVIDGALSLTSENPVQNKVIAVAIQNLDGRITAVEGQFAEGVTEAVNNWLAAHPEATTTVQDGAITYAKLDTNLKGEVDQISELKSAIDPFLSVGINLLNTADALANYYINKDNGQLTAYNGWTASDYIPVDKFTQYRLIYTNNDLFVRVKGADLYYAFYDANKTYTSGGIGDGVYARGGDSYVRISCPSSCFNKNIMFVTDENATNITTAADYEPYNLSPIPFIEKTEKAIEDTNLLKSLNPVVFDANNTEIDSGSIKYWNGEVESNSYYNTGYLDVKKYTGMPMLIFTSKRKNGTMGIAFYDDQFNFLSGVDYDDVGNEDLEYPKYIPFQIPKNASFIRATVSPQALSEYKIVIDVNESTKNLYQYAVMFTDDNPYWVNFNPSGTLVSLSDSWRANAKQAYTNMQNYLKATNAYDFATLLIETDSHGRGTLPFNWMQKCDNTIRCCHLGDIVDDYYNLRELEYYYEKTKLCKKLITIVGNHDAHYNQNGGQGNQYDLIRCLDSTERRIADLQGCFSVIDYEQRIKYICLNPYRIVDAGETCAITATEMTWFLQELNDSEFDIIVLSHNAIDDTNLVDRNGESGSAYIGGPYAVGYNAINIILKAFKNRTAGRIETTEYGNIEYDFTGVSVDLICNLAGHAHHELFKTGVYLTYVANWYGNTHCCVFFVANRVNKKVALFQFDNNTVYDMLEFSY